jgi:hypothetical protein
MNTLEVIYLEILSARDFRLALLFIYTTGLLFQEPVGHPAGQVYRIPRPSSVLDPYISSAILKSLYPR